MKHLPFLFLLLSLTLFFGCSQDVEEGIEEDVPDITVTLQNFGVSSWRITAIEGATGLADLNTDNPDITLEVGKRYKFINLGRLSHPLDFRDADEGFLLAQGASSGSFANDAEVNARINEEGMTFTLTQDLYDALATYNCAIHAVMRGNFAKEEPQAPEPDVIITVVNNGTTAWHVSAVEGATDVAELNTDNTSINLSTGVRYRIINNGGDAHPFQLRSEDGATVLLSQDASAGTFEADAAVNYILDGNTQDFTFTSNLAAVAKSYGCGIHAGMVGTINPETPAPAEPDVVITFENSGSSAWRITSVTGATDIVSLNTDNAALTLTKGIRYKFINQGGAGHPLQLINASNTVLLGKSSGSFNADAGVELLVEGNDLIFTFTEALANETSKYRCGVHTSMMVGNIIVN